jgi:hypothetical protein
LLVEATIAAYRGGGDFGLGFEDKMAELEFPLGELEKLQDGEPCGHPGCFSHVSHVCEGCGRIAAGTGSVLVRSPENMLADKLEQMSKELRDGTARLKRTSMNRNRDDPPVYYAVAEFSRPDNSHAQFRLVTLSESWMDQRT